MKIKSLKLENFAKYSEVKVDFDENVTYLIGKNGSGKSTLGLTAIWFIFEGIAQKGSSGTNPLIGERFRFIGPDGASAKGELVLYDEKKGIEIKVMRKLTKAGSELRFEAPEGMELDQKWLSDLFNVFLIAPKKFIDLSGKEQAIALGIDTSEKDKEIAELKSEYTLINREIKNLGNPEPVEETLPVNIGELNRLKNEIILFNQQQREKASKLKENKQLLLDLKVDKDEVEKQIAVLQEKLLSINARIQKGEAYVNSLPQPEPEKSTEDIDVQINNANAINDKALRYKQYKETMAKIETKKKELELNKQSQAQKELEKIAIIKSKEFPFEGMSVSEDGELLINDRPVKSPYFSSGELLKIVPLLMSTMEPELKYVFIQEFDLLDEDTQKDVEKYLTNKGFQLVIEVVGKEKIKDKNCILLKDMEVVQEDVKPSIVDDDPFA